MNPERDDWLNVKLAQRLRKLGLLEDQRTLGELDAISMPLEIQHSILRHAGTRDAIRYWINKPKSRTRHTTTELIVILEQMRSSLAQAAPLLNSHLNEDYSVVLARCSLNTARELYDGGRQHYAHARIDNAVNYMLDAQQEFLFALSTGHLGRTEQMEALGKYAVAVAFSSRWRRTDARILARALQFQHKSITVGNTDPEAQLYLTELYAQQFDATGDDDNLEAAINTIVGRHAFFANCEPSLEHRANLKLAELYLKRSTFRKETDAIGSNEDLNAARAYADHTQPQTGVEWVQKALVENLALASYLEPCPLHSRQIRLPYGFLTELVQMTDANRDKLRGIVTDTLGAMQRDLKAENQRPNIVAQQVLFGVLRDSALRNDEYARGDASWAVHIAREAMDLTADRYLEFGYAEALLLRASASRDSEFMTEAVKESERLVETYPEWPLPRVNLARALTLASELGFNEARAYDEIEPWHDAATQVVQAAEYRRTDLGGRSSVFAIEDARGDLAVSLVFKPTVQKASAIREAEVLHALDTAVAQANVADRFLVPQSLAIVQLQTGEYVHVIERQMGTLLSDLDRVSAAGHLNDCVQLLAIFHRTIGLGERGRSAWRKLKEGVKLWSRTLFRNLEEAEAFVNLMHRGLPDDLPLVRKRDAHASNWSVDSMDRLIAFDLEAASYLPVGHDLAQLIEDCALLPVDEGGFAVRRDLVRRYVSFLECEISSRRVIQAYDWFALLRATWVASSASASKARHSHARQLARHLATRSSDEDVVLPAEALVEALGQPLHVGSGDLDATHRRRSKRLSTILRHRALEVGLEIDDGGFVDISELEATVGFSADEVRATATHPAEPRFEVDGNRIRALYGHSIPVLDLPDLDVEIPELLFHGTSWTALDDISVDGLRPMGREKVHLTVNPIEALEVANRHERPALLAIRTGEIESLQSVADAIWTADEAPSETIEVLNPFAAIAEPPDWLTDVLVK
ncbi:RNA 2'-phosphotransferase [Candidatus Poriferisodalis sp.]|uniref:RNA 2'-phosphotransferase n=1 Tax=Candidatus Poriferisodalis sp. TaxID=3101277 RepID=UPI003D11EC67